MTATATVAAAAPPLPSRAPLGKLWWAFFAYAAGVAVLIQLVLLPNVFPAWHVGHGLLVGGDWSYFHELAADLAARIHAQGWSAWELRPSGQAPAGIAGAVYALTVPEPWTVIPINAALHATAALVLLRIVQLFVPDWRRAIWAALPFFLYPSALTWYAQIHKDSYSVAGSLLFIYGWMLLARQETWEQGRWPPLRAALWVVLGSLLAWVVRSFLTEMMQGVAAGLALLLSGVFVARGRRGVLSWRTTLAALLLVWALVVVLTPQRQEIVGFAAAFLLGGTVLARRAWGRLAPRRAAALPLLAWVMLLAAVAAGTGGLAAAAPLRQADDLPPGVWYATPWLPAALDARFQALTGSRDSFRAKHPEAGANIDVEIGFHSAPQMLAYLPRALQIAFLAPFPNQWFGQGSLEANTLMRRITAVEMVGVYLALAALPLALWLWRARPELWVALAYSTGMMLIYVYAITNVGAIYRYRYPYIMLLVALSIAGCLAAWERLGGSIAIPRPRLSLGSR